MKKDYYKNNPKEFIKESFTYDLSVFYKYMYPYFISLKRNAKVLDLGFGSIRDMLHFRQNFNIDIEGVDSCADFIKIARDNNFKAHLSELPIMNFKGNYDLIYSIGLIFHLDDLNRVNLFKNLFNKLNKDGLLVLSYNDLDRSTDEKREFFTITRELIDNQLLAAGFSKLKEEVMKDKRDFNWITSTYKK